MPPDTEEPLLAHDQAPSERSGDTDRLEEEDALLTGLQTPKQKTYGWAFWRQIGFLAWAVVATVLAIVFGLLYGAEKSTPPKWDESAYEPVGKRNLIFMVSDGMGPASLSLTRSFRQAKFDLPYDDQLILDEHLIGSSRTRSSSSLITDSAAGATAFSCASKSYNGAISVLPDHTPCGTVLEAAKRAGYMTGLVVTTDLTDATPACFAAHAQRRSYEDIIAEQEVGLSHPMGRVVDLMLGGGRCHFLPNSSTTFPSCRDDDLDVAALAQKEEGWTYISTRSTFDNLTANLDSLNLPLLGLFADTDIPYEIDRVKQNATYPSLDEMARLALAALTAATKDSDQGFFLMIEGSRIDHTGHKNDPAAQVHEVLGYDSAFSSVVDFLSSSSTPGLVVGTSDHETGGLATARQLGDDYPIYRWSPEVLMNVSQSVTFLSEDLHSQFPSPASSSSPSSHSDLPDLESYIRSVTLSSGLGVTDATPGELTRLTNSILGADSEPWGIKRLLSDMISRRAQVGWSTHGHSAVDVNIYAAASNPRLQHWVLDRLGGNRENTEVGALLTEWLGVAEGQEEATKTLLKWDEDEWMGEIEERGVERAKGARYYHDHDHDHDHIA